MWDRGASLERGVQFSEEAQEFGLPMDPGFFENAL
jgi:hypothetical protein